MMAPDFGHARYAELAAGYALHSLDPADEREFLDHARDCARCQLALADYGEVTASLAVLAAPADPPPQLGAAILAAAAREPRAAPNVQLADPGRSGAGTSYPQADPPGRVRVLPARTRSGKILAAAAAAVVAIGGVTWGVIAGTGGPGPRPAAAACTARTDCHQVVLASASDRAAVTIIVRSGSVSLLPAGLPADNTARQIYVLWQITGKHVPLAIGSFDVTAGHRAVVQVGDLAVPYASTWAFAVSLEHGRTIPAHPSHPVALGQVAG
jgi:Anti-sigma-K factor rskA